MDDYLSFVTFKSWVAEYVLERYDKKFGFCIAFSTSSRPGKRTFFLTGVSTPSSSLEANYVLTLSSSFRGLTYKDKFVPTKLYQDFGQLGVWTYSLADKEKLERFIKSFFNHASLKENREIKPLYLDRYTRCLYLERLGKKPDASIFFGRLGEILFSQAEGLQWLHGEHYSRFTIKKAIELSIFADLEFACFHPFTDNEDELRKTLNKF